jgi:hypothetical protein
MYCRESWRGGDPIAALPSNTHRCWLIFSNSHQHCKQATEQADDLQQVRLPDVPLYWKTLQPVTAA